MSLLNLAILALICSTVKGEYAFVSTLLSDDFLLAARVMAHNLKKIHPNVPYVIMYTDEVANQTIELLDSQPNVIMHKVDILNSPQYATHHAKKFQYTKLNLWTLDDYKAVIHVDLDTVIVDKIDELFRCGAFCASLRHSDSFNAGVMALRPNKTIYNDILNNSFILTTYDGGDQGFLNSYFWQIKYSTMFDPNSSRDNSNLIQRFSSAYNYDAGMYYLSSKLLVQPKIIHYTMAFVKPWHWYGYPLFDLNWKWLQNRMEMHLESKERIPFNNCIILQNFLILFLLLSLYQLSGALRFGPISSRILCKKVTSIERQVVPLVIIFVGILFGLHMTPLQMIPHFGWSWFTVNFSLSLSLIAASYSRLRLNNSNILWTTLMILFLISLIHLIGWHLLIWIEVPGKRILGAVCILIFYSTSLYNLLWLLIFGQWDVGGKCRWSQGMDKKKGKCEEMDQLTDLDV